MISRKKRKETNGFIRDFDFERTEVVIGYRLIYIISLFCLFVFFFPLVWVFISSFKTLREFVRETSFLPKSFDFESFSITWNSLKFSKYYLNSGITVAGSVVCAVLFNGSLGYVLSRIKPFGSKVIEALVLWGLLIPMTTSIVPLFINITKIGLSGSFLPLWLSMGANAFYVVLFKNFFDSLPKSLLEAARIDGASDVRIFIQIAVPLSKAIIMVVVLYAVTASWSDFLLPFLLLQNTRFETVMVKLFSLMRGAKINDVEMLRAIVFAIIPPILLFIVFQKQITQVTIQSGIKG